MGHSHGAKWTDDLIKKKIREVMSALEIDRMPSQRECEQHFHNCSLTNAISKRTGWYALANEMGIPIKESETYFGKRQEKIASEQIISHGYEVRRMPQNFPYDLLVNDCVKIDVKASRLYRGGAGNFYSFNLEKPFCTCDIYMLYLLSDDNIETDLLIVPSKFVPTNTQISVGEKNSKYRKYSNKWAYIEKYCRFMDEVV